MREREKDRQKRGCNCPTHRNQMEFEASGRPQGHGKKTRYVEKTGPAASWEISSA